MKKIYGLAALAAAMTLASCSNDNEPNVTPGYTEAQTGYIAVSIAAPSDGTRGDTSHLRPGENDVNNVHLLTFTGTDDNGTFVEDVEVKGMVWNGSSENGIEKTGVKVVTITDPIDETTKEGTVKQVIAVLNMPSDLTFNGKTLKEVRTTLLTATQLGSVTVQNEGEENASGTGSLVMSNSAQTGPTYAAVADVFTDEKEATSHVTTIYVERAAARVDAVVAENFSITAPTSVKNPTEAAKIGEDAITVKVEKVGFGNQAQGFNLVKDIDDVTDKTTGWSSNSYRTHWAAMPTTTFANYTYGSTSGLETYAKGSKFVKYFCENTSDAPTDEAPTDNQPFVFLTAQIYIGETPVSSTNTLYQAYADGLYYLGEEKAKDAMLELLWLEGYTNGDAKLTRNDISFDKKDSYSVVVKFGDGVSLKKDGESKVVATVNADFKADSKRYRLKSFTSGKCYYWTYIGQGTGNGDSKIPGIVRNHIYQLNLNGLVGLGVPSYDPSTDIKPENPDPVRPEDTNSARINATINILDWSFHSEDVTFQH